MNIWLAFVVIQAADVLTTLIGFSMGGRELNPLIAYLLLKFGSPLVVVSILKIATIAIIFSACFFLKKDETKIVYQLNIIFIFIVIWNVGMICAWLISHH